MDAAPGITAAILLAGGRGSRLGGVDKGALLLGGRSLLDRALEALAGIDVVLVGPPPASAPSGLRVVRESPPFSGPAAAVAAGVVALPESATEALVLAVDVPRLAELVPLLLAAALGADGVVAADPSGAPQWLTGRYRVAALRRVVAAFGDPRDRPVRRLLGGLDVALLPLPADLLRDVDTVADAADAGVRVPGRTEAGMSDGDDVGAVLDAWWVRLTEALGLGEVPADRDAILALAGEAAHGVVRPAAPITTFLAGYAAGRAGGSAADVTAAIEQALAATRV